MTTCKYSCIVCIFVALFAILVTGWIMDIVQLPHKPTGQLGNNVASNELAHEVDATCTRTRLSLVEGDLCKRLHHPDSLCFKPYFCEATVASKIYQVI
jgi:hypothetical protein